MLNDVLNLLPAGFWLYVPGFLILMMFFFFEKYSYYQKSRASLKNKHVMITGGSSGIGLALGVAAVSKGADVTLVARDETRLSAAQRELARHTLHPSQRIFTLSLDVTGEYSELVKGVGAAERECGPIYMLVNCAGRAVCAKLEDLSASDIRFLFALIRLLDLPEVILNSFGLSLARYTNRHAAAARREQCNLNYLGSALMTKAVLEGMKSRGEGKVVLVSSAAGLLGIYGFTAYSPPKFALRGFAEALYMETVCHGITVTIAYPPDTDTPGFAAEEIGKPKETRLICESAGLCKPSVVAGQILADALAGKFSSYVGLEGFMLVTLTAGMSPIYSFFQVCVEFGVMGPFRLLAAYYSYSFRRIIQRCGAERNQSKKAE